MNNSKADLVTAWRNGLEPGPAIRKYCSPNLVEKYNALGQRSSQEHVAAEFYLVASRALGSSGRVANGEEQHRYVENWYLEEASLLTDLEAELIELIRKSRLHALGYAIPRALTDFPSEIPLDVLLSSKRWSGSSTVEANGLKFVSVRIAKIADGSTAAQATFEQAAVEDARVGNVVGVPATQPTVEETAKPGAPTWKDAILQAMEERLLAHPEALNGSIASNFPDICERIRAVHPNVNRGLARPTLYKHLTPWIKDRKSENPDSIIWSTKK